MKGLPVGVCVRLWISRFELGFVFLSISCGCWFAPEHGEGEAKADIYRVTLYKDSVVQPPEAPREYSNVLDEAQNE